MYLRRGFSLIELMIAVAITGILGAIAAPNFMAMQLRAKRAELPGNVDGIKVAQLAHDAAEGGFVDASTQPRALTGSAADKHAVAWPSPAPADWASLGWEPDGEVRGVYATWATMNGGEPDFCVQGTEDVAGTGELRDTWASTTANSSTDGAGPCGGSVPT